jgi:putative nucleotidyltransferase with HDIG domain
MSPETAASEPSAASMLRTRNRILPPSGELTAASEAITQKGEIQVDLRRTIQRFFGFRARPQGPDWWLVAYTATLTVILSLFIGVLLLDGPKASGPAWPLVVLALAALLAELQSVRLSPRAEVSVSALPIVLAAVIYGPLPAICVSVASLLPSFQYPYARWLTWTATRSIAAGCAGVAAFEFDGSDPHRFSRIVVAVTAATLVEQVGNVGLGSVVGKLRGLPGHELKRLASTVFLALPLYVPVTALLVYSYREISPWSVALFLFPALVAQKLFLLYQEQRAATEELARAMERREKSNLSFATALVATLDARDEYTAGHSAAVAVYARDIARRLGLDGRQQRLVHLCGLVHDIGKVGLPAGLLEKPGPLSLQERRQMEEHPTIAERILAKVEDYDEIAQIVRHHHERVDGRGYPHGLKGDEIPLLSRIIAVADAYNAMTSERPYRDAMPSRVARMRLAQAVETQFDTTVVAAFEAVLTGASESYRAGAQEDFNLAAQEAAVPVLVAAV